MARDKPSVAQVSRSCNGRNCYSSQTFSRQLYRASFKIKSLEIIHGWYGNQLMRECLAKNVIEDANFPKFSLIQVR